MIVPLTDYWKVQKGTRTEIWLPVGYGTMGERLTAPHEPGELLTFQRRAFEKGTKATVVAIERLRIGQMDELAAKHQGHKTVTAALAAFEERYGPSPAESLVWRVTFVLGDHSKFYVKHEPRSLRAKMGGGRDYTSDPKAAVRDGGGALDEDELKVLVAENRAVEVLREREPIREIVENIRKEITRLDEQVNTQRRSADLADPTRHLKRYLGRLERLLNAA